MPDLRRSPLPDGPARLAHRSGYPVLCPDVQLMRRQRVHYLYFPCGERLDLHRTVCEAVNAARAAGHDNLLLTSIGPWKSLSSVLVAITNYP